MLPKKPRVFVSAVTSELSVARRIVVDTLTKLGYEIDHQEVFITQPGTLLDYLRQRIDESDLVIHLVGDKYGAEPRQPPKNFGRCSYTQFELLYAHERKKQIIVIECDGEGVRDPVKLSEEKKKPNPGESSGKPEVPIGVGGTTVAGRDDLAYGLKEPSPEERPDLQEMQKLDEEELAQKMHELRQRREMEKLRALQQLQELQKLQKDYRERIKEIGYRREKANTPDKLENVVLLMRDDLRKLWRKYVLSMVALGTLLVAVLGVGIWSLLANKQGFRDVELKVDKVGGDVISVDRKVGVVQDTVIGVDKKMDVVQDGVVGINTSLKGPGVNGRLIVTSDAPGALAFIKGEKTMNLPLQIDLPRGRYEFSFYLHGHEPEFREVVIQSGDIKKETIHFRPEQTKFDANATYNYNDVHVDPYRFLDRDFWVRADLWYNEIGALEIDVLTTGEARRYRYAKLYGGNFCIGRMTPSKAEELQRAIDVEKKVIHERNDREEAAYFRKTGHHDRRRDGRVAARWKVHLDNRTFRPDGLGSATIALEFMFDVLEWDFTEAHAEADKIVAERIGTTTGSELVITENDGLGQALFGSSPVRTASKTAQQPRPESSRPSIPPPNGDLPAAFGPSTPPTPSAALKADAKAADAELNAAYREVMARSRRVDKNMVDQVIAIQRQWLAARDRIPDLAQQTAFVRQRTNTLRQQVAIFDQKMREYDAAHRGR